MTSIMVEMGDKPLQSNTDGPRGHDQLAPPRFTAMVQGVLLATTELVVAFELSL